MKKYSAENNIMKCFDNIPLETYTFICVLMNLDLHDSNDRKF